MINHQLIANFRKSEAELKVQGFERVASVLAGKDSRFVYNHIDGRRATIAVANENQITYEYDRVRY